MGGIAGDLAADLTHNFSISDKTLTAATQGQQLARDGAANATSLHEDALALLPRVPEPRQQFFKSHILVQSAMQRFSVDIIGALANATLSLAETSTPSPAAVSSALADVNAALHGFDGLFAAERAAEGDAEWRGMYWADRHRFTNYQARRREALHVQAALMRLQSGLGRGGDDVQIDCCQMEYAYQWTPEHLLSYPNFYDVPESRARDFVMVSCLNVTSGGGRCENSRHGGRFAGGSATVSLSVPPVVGAAPATIMYTLDGSDPAGHTARRYAEPLRISETTALRAVAVRDGRAAAQQRNATFVLA